MLIAKRTSLTVAINGFGEWPTVYFVYHKIRELIHKYSLEAQRTHVAVLQQYPIFNRI